MNQIALLVRFRGWRRRILSGKTVPRKFGRLVLVYLNLISLQSLTVLLFKLMSVGLITSGRRIAGRRKLLFLVHIAVGQRLLNRVNRLPLKAPTLRSFLFVRNIVGQSSRWLLVLLRAGTRRNFPSLTSCLLPCSSMSRLRFLAQDPRVPFRRFRLMVHLKWRRLCRLSVTLTFMTLRFTFNFRRWGETQPRVQVLNLVFKPVTRQRSPSQSRLKGQRLFATRCRLGRSSVVKVKPL